MIIRLIAVILVIQFWPVTHLTGQSAFRFIDSDNIRLTLPFDFAQNLIIIPGMINNSGILKLVLDSGIANTIITGLEETDSVTINAARKIRIGGLGDGTPIEAFYSKGNQIEITHPEDSSQNITGGNMDIFLLTNDQFELSRQLGVRVNGLLGSDWFENFIVGIDPASKEISFHDRENFNFKKNTRSFSKVPLRIVNEKAYIDVEILQENDSRLTVTLLIDTGASLSFWIAPVADTSIVLPRETVRSLIGQGLNGAITGVNGRIKKARIGPFSFKNPIISYPDSASISGLVLNSDRHGSMGNDIIRRFSVFFDFQGSAIYLKPSKWFNSRFSYNRSGMEVEKPHPLIPVYSIFSVLPGSPADLAGLKSGDLIESVNYLPAYNLKLSDINSILYGEEGKLVRLRIDRDGEKLKVRFHLERKI